MRSPWPLIPFLVLAFSSSRGLAAAPGQGGPVGLSRAAPSARFALQAPASAFAETQLLPLLALEARAAREIAAPLAPFAFGAVPPSAPLMTALSQGSPPARRPDVRAPPPGRRHGWAVEDGRVFWFVVGAGAAASLGTRMLLLIPASLVGALVLASGAAASPLVATLVAVAIVAGCTLVDSGLSAVASLLTFNQMSRFYEADYLPAFTGQLAGNTVAAGAFWLVFGFGGMLLGGLEALRPFLIGGAADMIVAFSVLGVLPAAVVTFLASLVVPAVFGAWALAATARPKPGYAIDPTWRPVTGALDEALPPERRVPVGVAVRLPGM